jgi:hypothetical protein
MRRTAEALKSKILTIVDLQKKPDIVDWQTEFMKAMQALFSSDPAKPIPGNHLTTESDSIAIRLHLPQRRYKIECMSNVLTCFSSMKGIFAASPAPGPYWDSSEEALDQLRHHMARMAFAMIRDMQLPDWIA